MKQQQSEPRQVKTATLRLEKRPVTVQLSFILLRYRGNVKSGRIPVKFLNSAVVCLSYVDWLKSKRKLCLAFNGAAPSNMAATPSWSERGQTEWSQLHRGWAEPGCGSSWESSPHVLWAASRKDLMNQTCCSDQNKELLCVLLAHFWTGPPGPLHLWADVLTQSHTTHWLKVLLTESKRLWARVKN